MKPLLWLAAVACPLVFAFSCSGTTLQTYCTGIPDAGCAAPVTNCVDPTCAAIYASDPTTCAWTFLQACPDYVPPHDAGRPADAADAADGAAPVDGRVTDGSLRDAGFVLPPGANGGNCAETATDLESPDCTVDEALACNDCCGCANLYVCSDGGWSLWGECSDAGTIMPIDGP